MDRKITAALVGGALFALAALTACGTVDTATSATSAPSTSANSATTTPIRTPENGPKSPDTPAPSPTFGSLDDIAAGMRAAAERRIAEERDRWQRYCWKPLESGPALFDRNNTNTRLLPLFPGGGTWPDEGRCP